MTKIQMTPEEIKALTATDVAAAKARAVEARKTRSGISTVDMVLCRVDDKVTLDRAKSELIRLLHTT